MKFPALPGPLNAPLPKALILAIGIPLLLCCGVGTVISVIGGLRGAGSPAATTTAPVPRRTVVPVPVVTPTVATETTTEVAPPPPPPPPAPDPEETEPSGNDPRFATCTEAKKHGYGPYRKGVDPEYGWYVDRDRDGVVCE